MSFRLKRLGFDLLQLNNGAWFIQYGTPPRFVLYRPRPLPTPLFMMQAGWKTVVSTRRLRAGYVGKPVDLQMIWRQHADRTRKDNRAGTHTLRLGV